MIAYGDYLHHTGTPQMYDGSPTGSGRYRQGSGDNPHQHKKDLLTRIKELEDGGLSATEIKEVTGLSSGEVRALKSLEKHKKQQQEMNVCLELHNKGMKPSAISRQTGIPDSSVRRYLKPEIQKRINERDEIVDILKKEVDKKKYLDVGKGVELQLGITRDRLVKVTEQLKQEGYTVQYLRPSYATNPDRQLSVKVLTKKDVPYAELNRNRDQVQTILDVYRDDGIIKKKEPPVSIDSSRIKVRYAEDGGTQKDGVIELRPGVADISLGNARYSQVRIAVDDTHYLKGMAMYADGRSFPKGCDIIFNTNKHRGTPLKNPDDPHNEVLKPLKLDKQTGDLDVDNPFGAIVRQKTYTAADGTEKLSPINIVNADEDWDKWSKTLSSQFLSKQWPATAKERLNETYNRKKEEYEALSKLTNPVLKERLLRSFADDCDSAAVHLKAAGFDRQSTAVLLPMPHLKPNEIYAPQYKNGEEVVLIRHPHEGIFQIPRLIVNNTDPKAKKLLGDAQHAVGIHYTAAEQLSGADYDGDTAIVIPTAGKRIRTSSPIAGLATFDTKAAYPAYEGMPEVGKSTGFRRDVEMGKASNLITDMTLKGANISDLARATRYAMVVIDAEKHNLDWRGAYEREGIAQLKKDYQGKSTAGASTIISRAKSPAYDFQRDYYKIDPETGKKIWHYTEKTHGVKDKDGNWSNEKQVPNKTKSTKMYEAEDAYELTSDKKGGVPMERVYADYANAIKALANQARKDTLSIESTPYSSTARQVYKKEVESLQNKLNLAISHNPKERKAQLVASKIIAAKKAANPDMTKEEEKKMRSIAIADARSHLIGDTSKQRIKVITSREWEAIQSGAVTKSMLNEIIDNADADMIKKLATPRSESRSVMTAGRKAQARALLANGYTQAEVAKRLGVSKSTLSKALNE